MHALVKGGLREGQTRNARRKENSTTGRRRPIIRLQGRIEAKARVRTRSLTTADGRDRRVHRNEEEHFPGRLVIMQILSKENCLL